MPRTKSGAPGRFQARRRDADGVLVAAPTTFATRREADDWLADAVADGVEPGDQRLATYAREWLAGRDVRASTKAGYERLIEQNILPPLGHLRLSEVDRVVVRKWYNALDASKPSLKSAAYNVLHAIFRQADDDGVAPQPCKIKGAGTLETVHKIVIAEPEDVWTVVEAMPARFRLMVLLAAWCTTRFGEVTELRRKDIVGDTIRIERAVTWVKGEYVVGLPKSRAGVRDVVMPEFLVPLMVAHLAAHVGPGPDALLFPADHGGHLANSTMQGHFNRARAKAGRPDLRFHDLRHTALSRVTMSGGTQYEAMRLGGHSSLKVATKYQHTTEDRSRQIAAALNAHALAGRFTLTTATG